MKRVVAALLSSTVLASACSSDSSGPSDATAWASITAGSATSCGITEAGASYCWGRGVGDLAFTAEPAPVTADGVAFTSLAPSAGFGFGTDVICGVAAGALKCAGNFLVHQDQGMSVGDAPTPLAGGDQPSSYGLARAHACAVSGGVLRCWGDNDGGKRGFGAASDGFVADLTPNVVAGTYASVTAGFRHTCAIDPAGAIYCWGLVDLIGNATVAGSSGNECAFWIPCVPTPTAMNTPERFTAVSASVAHTCGVTVEKAVRCWGTAEDGRLGTGNSALDARDPVAVSLPEAAAGISTGEAHTCALLVTGSVYCWGSNAEGQLGFVGASDGLPTKVPGSLRFRSVSAGGRHTCGVTTDGEGYCWGLNDNGQLGSGAASSHGILRRVDVAN